MSCHHHSTSITKTDSWKCGYVRTYGDTTKTWQCHHNVVCDDCKRITHLGVSPSQCPEYRAAHSG